MWRLAALVLVCALTRGQQQDCTCIPAYMCTDGNVVTSSKCNAALLEVCCDVELTDPRPEHNTQKHVIPGTRGQDPGPEHNTHTRAIPGTPDQDTGPEHNTQKHVIPGTRGQDPGPEHNTHTRAIPGTPDQDQENDPVVPWACGVKRGGPLPPPPPTSPGDSDSNKAAATGHTRPPDYSVIQWRYMLDGALDTIRGEYPWIVAIATHNTTTGRQTFQCAGTIIYDNIVLTTAHNVKDLPASEVVVKVGVWDTADPSEQHVNRGVSRILIHPEFSMDKVQNDFAMLVLNDTLAWSQEVAPLCLPEPEVFYDADRCIAIGWGKTKEGKQYTRLRQVYIPLTNHTTCEEMLRKYQALGSSFSLHDSFLCGGGKDLDTCEGDGGGPLMCPLRDSSTHYVQVGITSWGVKGLCYSDLYPGVYSRVAYALAWIKEQAEKYPSVTLRLGEK